jgi:hypothetical protein
MLTNSPKAVTAPEAAVAVVTAILIAPMSNGFLAIVD